MERLTAAADDRTRIAELDGLRGVAILLVVVWHYVAVASKTTAHDVSSLVLFHFTWSGVDLFFVLSGFLIGGILIDHREAPRYYQAFYARRFCRIVPLYFTFLAAFYMARALAGPGFEERSYRALFANPLPWWSYFTFTQNLVMAQVESFGPIWLRITWSLGVEEQIYMLLPLVVRWTNPRVLPWLLGGAAAAAPVIRQIIGPTPEVVPTCLPFCRADALLLGVLCAWMMRQQLVRSWLVARRSWLYGLLLLQLGVVFALGVIPTIVQSSPNPSYFGRMALLYATLLLLAVSERRGPVQRVLSARWLGWFGSLAYGLYLCHEAVNGLLHAWILGRPARLDSAAAAAVTAASFVLAVALAALSWRYFERPLVALGHRVRYREPASARSDVEVARRLQPSVENPTA